MRILICVADIFFGEPNGVLQLSAIVKRRGHDVKLLPLGRRELIPTLVDWNPDVVAYSAMSPDIEMFRLADAQALDWAKGRRVLRIMGGPHATYFPKILTELGLDAICIGEGDNAFPEIIDRFARNEQYSGIPNLMIPGDDPDYVKKELISNLDDLPFIDREVYYEAAPNYRFMAMRGLMTGRGCPYECTYCHNHAFKKIFRNCGKIVRRRSVNHVISEMKEIMNRDQNIRLFKISDDTFAHVIDEWLIEFLDRYKREINIPFYCLMRSNTLTDEMAKRLSEAGCVSIGMSVESGNERIRNEILKRGLKDKVVINSFNNAHRYGMRTYGNTLLALPGATFEDDFESFCFTKRLKMTVPTFGIFSPYPRTQLTDYAIGIGALPADFDYLHHVGQESALLSFTASEKAMQLNLVYLGTIFADLPDMFIPVLRKIIKWPLGFIYKYLGTAYMIIKTGMFIFPKSYPRNPVLILRMFKDSILFFVLPKKGKRYASKSSE